MNDQPIDKHPEEPPLQWPEDDSPPPSEGLPTAGAVPPQGGASVVEAQGWPGRGSDGAETETEYRLEEDDEDER